MAVLQLRTAEQGTVATRQVTTDKGEQISREVCEAQADGKVVEPVKLSRSEFVGPVRCGRESPTAAEHAVEDLPMLRGGDVMALV